MEKDITLSVCIPNYNRPDKLEKLVRAVASQILDFELERTIEICISDDCSLINPNSIIETLKMDYPTVLLNYRRNEQNMGMDYNFLSSVMMAHGKYAWIIGNDDLPTERSLWILMETLSVNENNGLDFIITPFDCFDYNGCLQEQNKPFGCLVASSQMYDTSDPKQLHQLIMSVDRNGVLFDFLSNVVFKRERWIEHGDMFEDKMDSIFIQIYMNMQTLIEGAKLLYLPEKIIKNYLDYETNGTIDRQYRVFVGLYDAYQYFLQGDELAFIKRKVIDRFLQSELLELDKKDKQECIEKCQTEKMEILKKYYVKKEKRKEYFKDRSVIIYGAGKFGIQAANELKSYEADMVGFCDIDKQKVGTTVCNMIVFGKEKLLECCGNNKEIEVVVANFLSLVPIVRMLEQNDILKIAIIT